MPRRLFERLSAAFWGYVSPPPPQQQQQQQQQQVVTRRGPAVTRTARPPAVSPTRLITPRRNAGGYLPITPADTHAGSKRKRGAGTKDQRKRSKYEEVHDEDEAEEIWLEDSRLENMAGPADQYEADGPFSEDVEYDSGDEDGEGAARYDYHAYKPAKTVSRVFEEEEEEDEAEEYGVEHDYSLYNPTIRSDKPFPGRRALLASALPRDIPKIVVDSAEEEEDNDMINVLARRDSPVYGNGDEDVIVFADTDASDNDALDADHDNDNSSAITSHNNASLFESFFEEAIDGDTILVDSRARVGSLEDERVTKQQLLDRNWPESNVWLVQRIHNRGREPLFAHHWHLDFPMMPEGMFLPPNHPHPGYINTLRSQEFRAKNAFERLMQLGPKVRDKGLVGLSPENLIVDEIRKYMDWADWDASNQFPHHPFIKIHAGDRDEDVEAMQDELLSRLHKLHLRWSDPSDATAPTPRNSSDTSAPPLYGILVSHTLVGIVAFVPGGDASDSAGYLRTVGVFDFSISGYDVWTSLALALLVVHVRDVGVKRGCSRRLSGQRDRWVTRSSLDVDA